MTDKKKGIITSVLFLAFSIVMLIYAKDIEPMMKNDLGSGFFPMVVGIAMCGLSVLRLVLALREKEKESKKSNDDLMGGLGTLILIGAYCIAFNPVGFIISTIVYLFLQILLLTPKAKRNWLVISIISVVTPFAFYALFVYLINTPLPRGLFGF
jgi:putative tricarboxylic transport membrane protein